MKHALFIPLLFLISCSQATLIDGVVEISGFQNGVEQVRGVGACLDTGIILTSAHVVRDDRLTYTVGGTSYVVQDRDTTKDIAYLFSPSSEGAPECHITRKYTGNHKTLSIGDALFVPVVRSGSFTTLSGHVLSLTGSAAIYDTAGRMQIITPMLETDIVGLLPGDSGAPIIDQQGVIVDVVHAR